MKNKIFSDVKYRLDEKYIKHQIQKNLEYHIFIRLWRDLLRSNTTKL